MSPAGMDSGRRNAFLTAQLVVWAKGNGTGVAFDSSAGCTLPNSAIRSPDACWMTKERWNQLADTQKQVFSPVCPDFVVELRSPSDTKAEVREKMQEYLDQGARLGWFLDPIDETVEIYRPGRPVEVLKRPATLSGQDVLPGFDLDLAGILFD